MNTAQKLSTLHERLDTKHTGKMTHKGLHACTVAHSTNVVTGVLKSFKYKVYWHSKYDNGKGGYSGLPVGPGVYVRTAGWLTPIGSYTSVSRYDVKVGKGTSDGDLTRFKGNNQTLHSVEIAFIPCATVKEAEKVEKELREHFKEKGWQETDDKKYNIGGVEHVHKEFNAIDDGKRAIADIKSVICSYFNAPSPSLNDFKMRPEQQECHDKALQAIRNGSKYFLIAALMRFGKTFVSYQIMKTLDCKLSLILTYLPSDTKNAWKEELEKHVDFSDYKFLNLSDICKEDIELDSDKKYVIFGSAQYLQAGSDLAKKDWIYELPFDLLFVDERHQGGDTDNFKEIVGKIAPHIARIDLSGTPYKILASGAVEEEHVFRYDKLPVQMDMRIIDFLEHICILKECESAGFVDEDGFHLNKFFAAEADRFVFEAEVEAAFIQIFGLDNTPSGQKKRKKVSPFYIKGIDRECLKHGIIAMPSRAAREAACKVLSELLPTKYEILNASDFTGDSEALAKKIAKLDKENKNTILVTCQQFRTGITVPEWGYVLMLEGSQSPEKYFQTGYRASSIWQRGSWQKNKFYVFDFDPSRCLELVYRRSMIMKLATQSIETAIREWFDCVNLYVLDGAVYREIFSADLIKEYESRNKNPFSGISSTLYMNPKSCSETAIASLMQISVKDASIIVQVGAMTSKGKISSTVKEEGEINLPEKELNKFNILERIKCLTQGIPSLVIAEKHSNLSSLIENSENFETQTGVSIEIYKDLLDTGVLSKQHQDEQISRIYSWLFQQ